MSKFKIGDKVKIIRGTAELSNYDGQVGKVIEISDKEENSYWCKVQFGFCVAYLNERLGDRCEILTDNNIENMSLKEKFVSLFLSEPEKTFREVGITNGDGYLTDDGQKIFLTWLLKKNGDTFKTEVVDSLKEEKK